MVPASLQNCADDGISQVTIVRDDFGKTASGATVERYTMTNKHHTAVQVITFGARVVSVSVADRHGKHANVLLGCDDIADCESSYVVAILGRVSNDLDEPSFVLNGIVYNVSGITSGWDKHLWRAHVEKDRVVMSLRSGDGDSGFPGELDVNVTYRLTDDNKLMVTYAAVTKKRPVLINLSSRLFFNLAGESSKSVSNHSVAVFANSFLQTDAYNFPTGVISPVSGTTYDLRSSVQLGAITDNLAETDRNGINVTYCLPGPTGSRLAARVHEVASGRVLTVFTNQPAVQFCASNHLNFTGKTSHSLPRSGFLLETQNYPDAVRHSNFPDSVLTKGSLYKHEVTFAFATEV